MVLTLAGLLTVAASPARADEAAAGKALLAGGIISDVGSLASAIACGTLLADGIGSTLDNDGPNRGLSFNAVIASCTLNVALGIAGTALTVVGAKKLEHGRTLSYSLNRVAVHF